MDTRKPTVVVFGATGAQGSSVVQALQKDGDKWAIRGVSRTATSSKAQELAKAGVQMHAANLHSEDDVRTAVEGAYAVFGVTNYWDPKNGVQEKEQGERLARLSKEAGVTHFLWSTVPDCEAESGSRWCVPHFQLKARVNIAVAAAGFKYHTFVQCGFYYSNFSNFRMTSIDQNGTVVFNLGLRPDDKHPAYDVADTGEAVVAALNDPEAWGHGQKISFCGTYCTAAEYVKTFSIVTGKKAQLNTQPLDTLEIEQGKGLAHMWGWYQDYGYYGSSDMHTANRLVKKLKTWEEWLRESGWQGESDGQYLESLNKAA